MIKHFLKFLRALVLGACRTCLIERSLYCLTAPYHIGRALFTSRGSSPKAAGRLEDCEGCPLYDERLETCGNAIHPERDAEGDPLGCFCYMPLKVSLDDATCWLNERTDGEFGWREENQ